MPLAWGAKAHAGYATGIHLFLQAAEGQGIGAPPDWYSGFLFSWEVILMAKSVLQELIY
jgi:hypothetical protein